MFISLKANPANTGLICIHLIKIFCTNEAIVKRGKLASGIIKKIATASCEDIKNNSLRDLIIEDILKENENSPNAELT